MDGHKSWFNLIIPFYDAILAWAQGLLGVSVKDGTPVHLQYVYNFLFVALIILVLLAIARRQLKNTKEAFIPDPKFSARTFFEAMIEGILNTMEGIMDRKAALYFLPLIGTCAFMIFFSNFIGLVPGFQPPTSNLSTTLAMAAVIFMTTHIYGVKEHGFIKYFGHFCGPLKSWNPLVIILMILMFCIEMVSHIARPLSLSVRLMGNMFADHAVVAVFIGIFPLFIPLAPLTLGVVVCIVQTAVFCILSTVYIGGAVAHEEH